LIKNKKLIILYTEIMNLEKLNLVELNAQEVKQVEGGVLPLVAWWAGATLLAKCGVIAGGVSVVACGAAVGYYNGRNSTIK
jgi:hypothetical protein